MKKPNQATRVFFSYLLIIVMSALNALSYQLFVFPNKFAPAGLNGICTMVQYVFHFKLGYLSLIINIPLAILVFFLVNKKTALRSLTYAVGFSFFLLLLDKVDLTALRYSTENGTSLILGPLVAGLCTGACGTAINKVGANFGGTEFIASVIHKYKPHVNFFWIIFALNVSVAVLSYFVYGYKIEPVLLCVIYCFGSSSLRDKLVTSSRRAVRYEIVTDYPEELAKELMDTLHHGVTLTHATGMYEGKDRSVLLCIVNKTQTAAVNNIVRNYPNTFVMVSTVDQVLGNFKQLDSHGRLHASILDSKK